MALAIRLSALAESDARQIYIQSALDFGLRQAKAYRADILSAVAMLSDYPEAGREEANGVRSHPVTSHRIYYRVADTELLVLRVLHARQLPPGEV